MKMIRITTSDGVTRMIEGKLFDNELRVYRVYGDITNYDALVEMAQILSLQFNVPQVTLSI